MKKSRFIISLSTFISIFFLTTGSLYADDTWNGTNKTGIAWRDGNVGIGTTSPSGKLDVSGSTGSDTTLLLRNPGFASTDSATLQIETTNEGDADPTIRFNIPGFTSWYLGVDNSDADKLKIGNGLLGSADILTIDPSAGLESALLQEIVMSGYGIPR